MRKLIEIVRQTATNIENELLPYDWHQPEKCNCGLLVVTALGITVHDLDVHFTDHLVLNKKSTWTNVIKHHCPITGMPEDVILSSLMKLGMKREDFHHVEFCNDPEVLVSMPHRWKHLLYAALLPLIHPVFADKYLQYKTPKFVVSYLRTWANILEKKQQAAEAAEAEEKRLEAVETRPLKLMASTREKTKSSTMFH